MTCDFKVGPHARCGGALEFGTDRLGRTLIRCARCERRKAGICMLCPRRVVGCVGKALYCDPCRAAQAKVRCARWYHRNLEHARAVRRASAARQLARKNAGKPPRSPEEIARARGLARAAALTPERRREIARNAVRARWDRAKAVAA